MPPDINCNRSLDIAKAYESVLKSLWYLRLPCFDIKGVTAEQNGQKAMLKKCLWKGIEIPCAAIFSKVTTDQVEELMLYPNHLLPHKTPIPKLKT